MTDPRTETQAAIAHLMGKLGTIMVASKGRDPEEVMQEIGYDVAILMADLNDAKADENNVPSKREIKLTCDYMHDTIFETFSDTNTYIENARVYGERTHLKVVS